MMWYSYIKIYHVIPESGVNDTINLTEVIYRNFGIKNLTNQPKLWLGLFPESLDI